jgi:type II secretory ATPase GspE/PulE/Tfp pilus assembly ATPase PilB-like protein
VTVEDPVEFEVDSFAQSQVSAETGHGFAEALRAVLRQDPNVILLGEIRDAESATIACRMALTGHVVLSTLHTYDAVAAVARLVQMGVPPYVVAAVVKSVLAQRLVRKLCAACSRPEPLDRQWLRAFDREKQMTDVLLDADVRGPEGCERCGFRGFKGRLPIFELLDLGPTLAQQVREGRSDDDLRRSAILEGFRPLRLSALARVAAGDTSQAEVARVL